MHNLAMTKPRLLRRNKTRRGQVGSPPAAFKDHVHLDCAGYAQIMPTWRSTMACYDAPVPFIPAQDVAVYVLGLAMSDRRGTIDDTHKKDNVRARSRRNGIKTMAGPNKGGS